MARASSDARVRYHEVRHECVPAAKIIFFDAHGTPVRKERRVFRVPDEMRCDEKDAARAVLLREMETGARAKLTPNAVIAYRINVRIFDDDGGGDGGGDGAEVSVQFFWEHNNTTLLSIHVPYVTGWAEQSSASPVAALSDVEAAPKPHVVLPAPLSIASFSDAAWKAAVLDALLSCSALSPGAQTVLDVSAMRNNARHYLDTYGALDITDDRPNAHTIKRACVRFGASGASVAACAIV